MTYLIGYRRPPKSGRFKKGKSGNPKGRLKGVRNFFTLLDQELLRSISITDNGKTKTISRMQAIVKRLVAGALNGAQKQLITLVEIQRRNGKPEQTNVDSLLPEDYESQLNEYVAQHQRRGTKTPKVSALKRKTS